MNKFQSLFTSLREELTIRKFWSSQLSSTIAFAYFLILQGNPGTSVAQTSVVAMLISLVGMQGLCSIVFDPTRTRSQSISKPIRSSNEKKFFGVLYGILMISPWYFLPLDPVNGGFLIVEIVLLLAINKQGNKAAIPPTTHLFLSILAKRIIPLIITIWTFYLVGNRSYEEIFIVGILSIAWQFLVGMRLQLEKFKVLLLSLEILIFSVLCWFLKENLSYAWIILAASSVGIALSFFRSEIPKKVVPITSKILDTFYVNWMPFFFLISTIFIKTEVTVILVIHLLFVQNAFRQFIFGTINWLKHSKLRRFLFDFSSYRKGLIRHLVILVIYTLIFCLMYVILGWYIHDEPKFFEFQRILSRVLVLTIFFHGLLIVALKKDYVILQLKEFILEPGSPRNLAFFRILFFIIVLGSFHGEVFVDFEHWTHLPDSERAALPFIGWLIESLPITPEIYRIVSFIGLGLAISALIGFKTRWALILYVPIALYLWGVPNFYGKLNHRHIMVWVPIILSFSRCADVFSVDALIMRYKGRFVPLKKTVEYALPFKMTWVTLGIIYCASGFHKLWDTGLFWALSDNLKNQIQLEWVEQYDTIKSIRIDHYPVLLNIGGIAIILMEIIYPVLILKSYTRVLAFAEAWFLHLSAGYFLFIDFFHLRIVNLSLINWAKLGDGIRAKVTRKELSEKPDEAPFDLKRLKRMPIVYVGGGLIALNLMFSIAQVNSWPFSAYPSYSNVVPNEVSLIRMDAWNSDGSAVDVKAIGKNAKFRWETIRPFEERISELIVSDDTTGLQNKLVSYWSLWSTKVDSLEKVSKIEMSLITTGLAPEKRHIVLDSVYLGELLIDPN